MIRRPLTEIEYTIAEEDHIRKTVVELTRDRPEKTAGADGAKGEPSISEKRAGADEEPMELDG